MTKVALVAHWDWVLHNFRLPVARALAERGYEVVLVCPRGRYSDGFAQHGFRWVEWGIRRRSLNPFREWRSVRSLTRIYREEAPDVVHHFTIKPNLYGSIAARDGGVNKVVNTFTGLGFLFSEDRKARVIRPLVQPVMQWAFRYKGLWTVFQNADDMLRMQGLGLADPDRCVLIEGTGVDTDRYKPRSKEPSTPVVLMAARLIREKGVADLVEAAR
ncbi:MAG: glycosyltransferase, partial [Actinobacteria bacterium]|nr:glycosyltransferase [Actinomycetota bacterium]